jgi:hypothetical protein
MTDTHPDRKDDEKGMLETAVDKTKEAATYVADTAKDVFHAIVGDDDDAKKKAEDADRTMMDAAKEKVNDTWSKTQEMAGQAKEKMEETLRGARETGEEGNTDPRSCAEQKNKEARDQLAAQLDKVDRFVEGY